MLPAFPGLGRLSVLRKDLNTGITFHDPPSGVVMATCKQCMLFNLGNKNLESESDSISVLGLLPPFFEVAVPLISSSFRLMIRNAISILVRGRMMDSEWI